MKYDILREAQAQAAKEVEQELFRATIIAKTKGGLMNEEKQFIYELIFKPNNPELVLRPDQIQVMLSYLEELLKQIEGRQ